MVCLLYKKELFLLTSDLSLLGKYQRRIPDKAPNNRPRKGSRRRLQNVQVKFSNKFKK